MNFKKVGLIVLIASFLAVPRLGAQERILVMFRSMLDRGEAPNQEVFSSTLDEDYIRGLPADSVKEFLPLARTALRHSSPDIRRYGAMCFFVVTLRFSDSEPLIEPYVPDLLRIVDDRASPLRNMVLFLLGNTLPKVSAKTLAYLAAHLADKENSVDDLVGMACMLVHAGSDRLTHDAIEVVRKQNKASLSSEVLNCIHLNRTKTADALVFIDDSLDSSDLWVRRRALEAITGIPLIERTRFLEKLNRLATDPNEPSETRSIAAAALKQ